MTKKMLVASEGKSIFVVPDYENNFFVAISNSKKYNEAMVVFTGVDLNVNEIINRAKENDIIITEKMANEALTLSISLKIGSMG
ncbi:MAG: hypothetical protein U5J96_01015 [Ignavibacteriaceae bacterium]|nr:hypothetical protein [Ignavibacteriaceae bacterium]